MKEGNSKKRKRGKHRPKSKSQSHQKNDKPLHSNDIVKPKNQTAQEKAEHEKPVLASPSSSPPPPSSKRSKSSSFLEKMRARLSGGHFRMINEKLYSCTGEEAHNYFKEDPSLFDMYHAGYQEQMLHWPEQPINVIVNWLKGHSPTLVVADFGCGDARLAKNVNNKVVSLDLISNSPSVIACDMSNTPLDASSVDVAVFCLSLMGTNYPSYIQEAHRVLKPSGWLLIAEVKSRFDPNNGGADPKEFSKAISDLGFGLMLKDFSNKMFILLYFQKKENQSSKKKNIHWPELKPCLYKRR